MEDISVAEASEHLEDLARRVTLGEDVRFTVPELGTFQIIPAGLSIIAGQKSFVPLAADRVPGLWKDRLPDPPAGFFDPLTDEELKDWNGDSA